MTSLYLERDDRVLVEHVIVASRLLSRMKGLLGSPGLPGDTGMLIVPCWSVHTFMMRFAIDVVFLSGDWRVVKTAHAVAPWRTVCGGSGAHAVLELESGWLDLDLLPRGTRVRLGD